MLLLAGLCLVVASLKLAQSLFVPILLAFFIATVSFPITNWLRDHKVPRAIAVLLTVLVDFAFLTGVVLLGVTLVGELQGIDQRLADVGVLKDDEIVLESHKRHRTKPPPRAKAQL